MAQHLKGTIECRSKWAWCGGGWSVLVVYLKCVVSWVIDILEHTRGRKRDSCFM